MKNPNPNTKNEIAKQFVWCSDHQATERVIPGLNEHVAVIPQDIEKLVASKLQEVERAAFNQVAWELTEILIRSRELGSTVDVPKVIKRYENLAQLKGETK